MYRGKSKQSSRIDHCSLGKCKYLLHTFKIGLQASETCLHTFIFELSQDPTDDSRNKNKEKKTGEETEQIRNVKRMLNLKADG